MKLTRMEVQQGGGDILWPNLQFHPEIYGRHWDVLLHLLKQLRSSDRRKKLHVLEIGVACGQNAGHLLRNVPEARYTGVDPTIHEEVARRCAVHGDRCEMWAEKSQDVVDRFADESLDLIFIDGPHTFAQVQHDVKHYRRKVKRGGFLAGHDFTCRHPPLLFAVCLEFQGGILQTGTDGVWWYQIP